jgi:hypothetical protein
MSRERFDDLLEELAVAWNEDDMDAFRSMLHAEVRHMPPRGWPEPGPFVGRDAVMTHFEQLREAFHAETVAVADVTPVDPERVLVQIIWRGTGLGPDAEIRFWQVNSFRDGLLIGMDQYWERDEALEAARASE